MAGDSQETLSEEEVADLLVQLQQSASQAECWSCECLQGFIAQLVLDAADDGKPLLEKYWIDPSEVRSSPGCESCSPAELFAAYLMRRREA